jgi:hypothetical protein
MQIDEKETAKLSGSRKPFLIVTGGEGSGKSTEVAAAFPDWLFYKTRVDTHRGLEDYIATYPEQAKARGIVMPKSVRTLVDDRDERGNPRTNWIAWFRETVYKWSMAAQAGKFPWPGIVIDEANTLLGWMQQSLDRKLRGEGLPGYPGQDEMIKLITWLHQVRSATGIGFVLVHHWNEPRLFEDGPKRGQVQHPGQPKVPVGRYGEFVTKDASAVWQVVAEPNGVTRKYYCRAEYEGTTCVRNRKTGLFNKTIGDSASMLLDAEGCWETREGFGLREACEGLGWDISSKPIPTLK